MGKYRYYTIGIVAALNKCIVDNFGADVLSEPYRRARFPFDLDAFQALVETERSWLGWGTVMSEELDIETTRFEHFAMQKDDTDEIYHIRIGVARRAKTLGWSTIEWRH